MIESLKWFASISGMVAALMIAWDHSRRITGFGFLIFVAASIAWIASSLIEGESPLAVQNGVLLMINLFGVYRYLIRKKETKA